jgi:hexosaminidase
MPDTGGYRFGPGTRVLAPDPELAGTAELLAGELQTVTGVRVPWLAEARARPGDLVLGTDGGSGEGYRLDVGSVTEIRGTAAGVFYGTRTLLQLLRQHWVIPAGRAEDRPAYPERGLMLDVGRKYLTMAFLRRQIRELGYLKLNHLHLHLSDDLGFRLESGTHPEITSAAHYTKAEITELVGYAARYHVRVLPEIDFPGHMGRILAAHPELKLVNRRGRVRDGLIDLSNPAAYALMGDLLDEFLPLFPGEYWHIGADEYVRDFRAYPRLSGPHAFARFVDWAGGVVRAAGKTARMWNDGIRAPGVVSPEVVVEHWSAGGRTPWRGPACRPAELVAAGHRVQNAAFTPTYYVTGGVAATLNVPPAVMYAGWRPDRFVDGSRVLDGNLGAVLHVWCDHPGRTEEEIAAAVYPRLRVMAQHTWGSAGPGYPRFSRRVTAVGAAPG